MSLHLIDNDGHLQQEKKIVESVSACVKKPTARDGSKSSPSSLSCEDILREVGVNYHVVGVFGGQSSGKSTLLNHLFATDFQTLDETVRRGQTTKGAFLSKADTGLEGFTDASDKRSPILVVDFEGTDGLERGEDQSFERQLSLFGLSIADTLIINMWSVDVGRFNAANLSLLRTIFEVNLQLFSHESYEKEEKPTLLIILRDFADSDPKPSLTTVRKSFDMIWDNISRPAEFADVTIDALFSLKYYVMPHYKLQRKEFDQSVTSLRHWFGDSKCKDYLFRHRAMFRGVPLEGLPQYMINCWDAIISSKDLDIPTQREMLAQHRCKEVKQQELRSFLTFTRHYEDRINRGEMLLRLSEVLDEEMDTRLHEYTRQTKLYNPEVVAEYAKELELDLVDATMKVVARQSTAVAAEVLAGLDARLQGAVDDCIDTLLKSAQSLPFTPSAMGGDGFGNATNSTTGMAGGEGDFMNATPYGGRPQTRVLDHVTRFYMDNPQCQDIVLKFWRTLRTDMNSLLNEMVVEPAPAHLYGRYTSLMTQDRTARGNVVNTVTESLFKKVNGRVAAMAESAAESIHRGFEQSLSHNADGTVKFFVTAKGLQQAVPTAQQAGLVFLGCLLYFRLRLAPANPEGDDVLVDATAPPSATKTPSSRSARRVVRDRKRVSLRQDAYEKEFFLGFTTLDTVPRYPVQVPIAPAPMEGEAPQPGVEATCVLLTQPQVQRTYEIFRQKCDFTTQIQLRSIEAGSQRLPGWVIPALLVLGFNEIKYVLTSPPLLIVIVIVGFVFFKNYIVAQWQAFEETGPATIVIPLQAVIRSIKDFYEQNIEPQVNNLQQYQQEQQQRMQAQHHGVASPPQGSPRLSPAYSQSSSQPSFPGYSGEYPVSNNSGNASGNHTGTSTPLSTPHNSEASMASGGMRQRSSNKTHAPKHHHSDPVPKATSDSRPGLPRRRAAE